MKYELSYENETGETIDKLEDYIDLATRKTLKINKVKGEILVSLVLVGKEKIQEINKKYRNIDKPTDVISFAYLDNEDVVDTDIPVDLGEIIICLDVAKSQAITYNHPLIREITFLYIHGLLHLLGFDHMTEEDALIMFPLQNEILNSIKFKEEK